MNSEVWPRRQAVANVPVVTGPSRIRQIPLP